MKKYIEIAKLMFKSQLSWRFDIAAGVMLSLVKILFAMILWGAIFGDRTVVSGFTLSTMISYYIISAFLSRLDMSDSVAWEVSSRIRDGGFSKYMVLPVRVESHFLWQTAGTAALHMIFNVLAIAVWVLVFRLDFHVTSDPWMIAAAALMTIMGLVFMVQLNFGLGILAFKFQDVSAFLMVKGNLIAFITGSVIPLALLPGAVVSIMRIFPFYYVTYMPAMLLIGQNGSEIGTGLLTLALWMLAFAVINQVAYGHLRRKYDGVGI